VLAALCLGLAYVGDAIASATGLKAAEAGLASGLINASQQIGGAIGLAATTVVAANRTAVLLHAGRSHAVALTGGCTTPSPSRARSPSPRRWLRPPS